MTTAIEPVAVADSVWLRRPNDLETKEALVELSTSLQDLPCTSETYPGICEALIEVKARVKSLIAQRETVLGPLREAERAAREWFRAPLETYQMIENVLKERVAGYQETLRKEKHAAIVAAGQAPTPTAMAQLTALATPPTPTAITFRKTWEVEITDPNLVPREYLLIDIAALRKVCVATKGQIQVPGVRFFQKDGVAVGK
jgi:hypothetical protein